MIHRLHQDQWPVHSAALPLVRCPGDGAAVGDGAIAPILSTLYRLPPAAEYTAGLVSRPAGLVRLEQPRPG